MRLVLTVLFLGAAVIIDNASPAQATVVKLKSTADRDFDTVTLKRILRRSPQEAAEYVGEVGHLGDAIELDDGEYELTAHYRQFDLTIDLTVGSAPHMSFSWDWTNCEATYETITAWRATMATDGEYILLDYGRPAIMTTTHYFNHSCAGVPWSIVRTIPTEIATDPAGAEVLINGKRVGTSNVTLSVPVRRGVDAIWIVLRKPGFAACLRKVDANAEKGTASCALKKLAAPTN
jgi:hypothetical protein